MEMAAGRQRAYASTYGDCAPFDGADFVATHYLFYDGSPRPGGMVGGFKLVSVADCDRHRLSLPIHWLLQDASPVHAARVQKIIQDHRTRGTELIYGGGFWISPRGVAPELKREVFELTAAILAERFADPGATMLCVALRKLTERFFVRCGCVREELPPAPHPMRSGHEVIVLQMHQPSRWAFDCLERFGPLLRNRGLRGAPSRPAPEIRT